MLLPKFAKNTFRNLEMCHLKYNLFELVPENVRHFSFLMHEAVTARKVPVISDGMRENPSDQADDLTMFHMLHM